MNAKLGIWIDHTKALIVDVARDHSVVTRLRSSLRAHGRYHGAQDGGGEKKYEARHAQGVAHFVDAVARHVERGDEVLILGPGESKSALARRIRQIKSLRGVATKATAVTLPFTSGQFFALLLGVRADPMLWPAAIAL